MAETPKTQPNGITGGSLNSHNIAVVGVGCKFPGADTLDEYWELLDQGRSMVADGPPAGRFPTQGHHRNTDKTIFSGNFLENVSRFDNRFFKKSSREAASMDPQQRLLLQVAYEALESSGFFGPHHQDTDVGCFVGVCASDYNDNVASNPPNAFSTLGTLRAFLTGKISHFFGFTGPSVTFDTACSSSAVAIDAACKAILHGDCTSALAGGVSLFSSPYFYQNLAAASFLSPTGATKSFDAGADGYCRGEGVGLVMLKEYSRAVADGDHIFGTILATSVKQSSNKVPITVPHPPSQTALYQKVLQQAGVAAEDVTFLEAHGTGTPIGDPQEFEGIRQVFGGSKRDHTLYFASVKGNIGHTEGASGVAGLIKTLLMMEKGAIPRQASFKSLNPKIKLAPGQFEIPTQTVPWTVKDPLACVNNYGAAGSIAAMVIKATPSADKQAPRKQSKLPKYPLLVSGNSAKSLGENCAKLRQHVLSFHPSSSVNILSDLMFNLSDRQNRSLPNLFATTVSSMSDLDDQLRIAASNPGSSPCRVAEPRPNSMILIFGGQTNRSVALSRNVYEASTLLRKHLDQCDEILKELGYSRGIYPDIFSATAFDDVVALQSMQFALHYACAQAWIESGLKVDCVIGHSFGQFVALTIAGVLSLEDGLKLVHGRAVLMQEKWGPEGGTMIALDADHQDTTGLISSVGNMNGDRSSGLEVACYNGPRSHVLVGSTNEINAVVDVVKSTSASKYKILNVTHGFHSRFCDPIIPDLEALASTVTFNEPKISVETCSEGATWAKATAKLIAEHTRTPVYFEDAVRRIEAQYGTCTWLEAGSNTSITSIARRALSGAANTSHVFLPVNLCREDAMAALAETTANLWKHGHHVQFWPFHRSQRQEYHHLHLPPYQFEKTEHWLEFKDTVVPRAEDKSQGAAAEADEKAAEPDVCLIRFNGFEDAAKSRAVFTIDPRSEEWQVMVKGHAVLSQPLCPMPLYIELVLRASQLLAAVKGMTSTPLARLTRLDITSSLGLSQGKIIRLVLLQSAVAGQWDFTFHSSDRGVVEAGIAAAHADGRVEIIAEGDVGPLIDFERTERLLENSRLGDVVGHPDADAVQGPLVYQVFSRVVQYDDFYKGVRKVAGYGGRVVAKVVLPPNQPAASQGLLACPVAIDNFLQVPGLYANCLASGCPPDEVFVCTHVDQVQIAADCPQQTEWTVSAFCTATNMKEISNDIFVTNQLGKLVMVAFGARFNRVRISSLAKVLSRANEDSHQFTTSENIEDKSPLLDTQALSSAKRRDDRTIPPTVLSSLTTASAQTEPLAKTKEPQTAANMTTRLTGGVEKELRGMLSTMLDIPSQQLHEHATLEELGVDSLMATEIVSDIHETFGVSIPQEDLQDLQTFASLRDYLDARGVRGTRTSSGGGSAIALTPASNQSEATQDRTQHTPRGQDKVTAQLASLLSSHLECPASSFTNTSNLADYGLDSLLCMELASDVEKMFGVSIDLTQLTTDSTFEDMVGILSQAFAPDMPVYSPDTSTGSTLTATPAPITPVNGVEATGNGIAGSKGEKRSLDNAPSAFESIRPDFDRLADEYQFAHFYERVYDRNSQLVLAYTIETFADLGIPLSDLHCGDTIPQLPTLPKHEKLRDVLYEILRDGGLADYNGTTYVRSDNPVPTVHSSTIFRDLVADFPQHAKEHMLLNLCGAELAKLMSGQKDPLTVLFGSKANRDILEDVYSTSPMYVIMSQLLTSFLERALSTTQSTRPISIIELGAGTGSTTRWVVDRLVQLGIPMEYTFTDISSSLVSAGKRKFSKYQCMKYAVINIEREPPAEFLGKYDIVLSTNCIHATSSLPNSLSNIHKLLRPDGFLALVEFTSRMYWFDIVFGLLEGWWLFDDGRPYVLATPEFWGSCMKGAGFKHVSWTGGSTRESEVVRIIAGFKQPVQDPSLYQSIPQERASSAPGVETLVFKHTDKNLPLRADIYYPSGAQQKTSQNGSGDKPWTVGLMIHGGGHVMLSRKDVRPRQIQLLLENRVLPVSVDYRLCPEVSLLEGPIADVSDAYAWARTVLPSLKLTHTSVNIDPSRAVAVGWSTGGTLAMSLAWTSAPRGLPPPDAVLAFYCPTDYEDAFWRAPNIPDRTKAYARDATTVNVLESVQPTPIAAYNVPPKLMAAGGWMSPQDARSRLVLHMNWHGQTLPVLLRGLPPADTVSSGEVQRFNHLDQPAEEDVVRASPYAQIVRGNYKSPTHIVFGTKDDLIPWQQATRTVKAMKEAGIEHGLTLLDNEPHLFDLYRDQDGTRWKGVLSGYEFVFERLHNV